MIDIAIWGAGGFGREVKTLIDDINSSEKKYNFIGFFDDGFKKGELINDTPILGGIDDLNKYMKKTAVAIALGDPTAREKICSRIHNSKIVYPTLIHPSVIMNNNYVKIGKGTIICAGCILTCNIELRNFIVLNLCCTIGHDSKINNYSSFMPSVNISGEVTVGHNVFVGTGVKIINKINIGANSIIGAGAVVSKSIPSSCTAVGIPAKPIKYHNEK
jgi:sugar O-acyltransferase (sialic acid O-acetyltransferase NeuD family)